MWLGEGPVPGQDEAADLIKDGSAAKALVQEGAKDSPWRALNRGLLCDLLAAWVCDNLGRPQDLQIASFPVLLVTWVSLSAHFACTF